MRKRLRESSAPAPAAEMDMSRVVLQNMEADYGLYSAAIFFAVLRQEQLTGDKPHTAHQRVSTDSTLSTYSLVPDHFSVKRSASERAHRMLLATNQAVSLIIDHNFGDSVDIHAVGNDVLGVSDVVERIIQKIPVTHPPDNVVPYRIWSGGLGGPRARYKKIQADRWSDIRRNYTAAVAPSLDKIMAMTKPRGTGKLILWHGAPGTGKTTAIRSLTREWKPWCAAHYITDPERMFEDPSYLLALAADEDEATMYRLLIAEDSDEFLREDARREAGAALGRLLNFADGILGQGSRTLILLTTNEPLGVLHPAVIRPGRCQAEVNFHTFTAQEAAAWLDNGTEATSLPERMTLADLIEHQHSNKIVNA